MIILPSHVCMTTYPGGSLLVENKVLQGRANALSSQKQF
ncbi:hypothetical protein BCAH1134_0109 [Bacillus cereus AH1134]|nr:hypothetical protein BCAH1134_0109 [Bacillus cereus AH1134]